MHKTNIFFRNTQRSLAVSLLLTAMASCQKTIEDPSTETLLNDEALNAKVSTRSLSNLLWSDNLEGLGFLLGVSKQTSTSYGITTSTNLFYQGKKSARFELRPGDKEANGGTRAELSFGPTTNLNRWYSYALYAPSDQYKSEKDDDVITQFHQGDGETPALCLRIKEDHIYIRILGAWFDLGIFEKDKWVAYVMHVKHSTEADGLIELWRNGVKIMNRSGANMYKVKSGGHNPSFKMGVYKSSWNGSGQTETSVRVIYYDDIKMGNEYATYADMVPKPNATNPGSPISGSDNSTPAAGVGVTDFKLINAATEAEMMSITNGQTISLSALKLTKTNIRAVATSNSKSVKIELSGQQSKTYIDTEAPFALHGDDDDGNFYYGNWNPPALGTYTLKATPYTEEKAKGTAGSAKTITFTIVK